MLEFVSLENAGALDAFVAAHPRGHIMQTSAWGRVKGDWEWTGLLCRDAAGSVRGTMATLLHRSRLPGCGLLYAPRGPVLDCGDAATLRALLDGAAALGRERGACLVRFDPEVPACDGAFAGYVRALGATVDTATDFSLFQPRLCYVCDLRGLDEAGLLARFHRSARNHVHKALRGPLTVEKAGPEALDEFLRLMTETAARSGFRPRPKEYFAALLAGLGPCGTLWIARTDRPVAAAITARLGKTAWFLYGCSDETGQKLCANELLQWKMQLDALRAGCDRFDLRGVEGLPDPENPHFGLHRYKQGLGGELIAYVGQLDLPLRPFLAQVYRWRCRQMKSED